MRKKLNPVSMKRENKRMVLRHLMEKGKDTRVHIANDTGLAPSAIWRLIGELEDEELVEVVDISKGKGRKSALYAPKSSFVSSVIYNVEVLETLVGVGFLNGSWKIVDKFETPKDFGQFKSLVIESFKSIRRNYTLRDGTTKVVFSLPGMVNYEKKFLINAPNLNWKNIDFQETFKELEFEVLAENDANLALLAEHFFCKDVKESKVAFFLYFGKGIGGAILVNGSIVRGKNSAAGEIGHVSFNGENCEVESSLSVVKLIDNLKPWLGNEEQQLAQKVEKIRDLLFSKEDSEKRVLEEVLQKYFRNIASAIRNITYLLNPDIIILGGLVNTIYEMFGSYIEKELDSILERDVFDTKIRDTVFKEVPPSLVGGNVLVLEDFLKSLE